MALMNLEYHRKKLERLEKVGVESHGVPYGIPHEVPFDPGPPPQEEFKEIHGRVHDHDKLFTTP